MFFFKQKTAYEMRISDWSSDVCSSDLSSSSRCRPWRRCASSAKRSFPTICDLSVNILPYPSADLGDDLPLDPEIPVMRSSLARVSRLLTALEFDQHLPRRML